MNACEEGIVRRSIDSDNPTIIDPSFVFTTRSNYSKTKDKIQDSLHILAQVGDQFRFYTMSEYGNIDNPVLIYSIIHNKHKKIIQDLTSRKVVLSGIEPNETTIIPPIIKEKMDYWFFEAMVSQKGKECFNVNFAIYQRDRKQDNPILFGYFSMHMILTSFQNQL